MHSWTACQVKDGFGPKSTFVNMHLWTARKVKDGFLYMCTYDQHKNKTWIWTEFNFWEICSSTTVIATSTKQGGVLTRRCLDRNLNAWLYSGLSCLIIASLLPHGCLMPALSKVSKLSKDPLCWPWWIRLMTLMDSHRNPSVHMHWWPWWIHTNDPWIRTDTLGPWWIRTDTLMDSPWSRNRLFPDILMMSKCLKLFKLAFLGIYWWWAYFCKYALMNSTKSKRWVWAEFHFCKFALMNSA